MADIGEKTLLGIEKIFKAFQGLIEGFDKGTHLIAGGALIGNAAREIIGAVDGQGGLRGRTQRSKRAAKHQPRTCPSQQNGNYGGDKEDIQQIPEGGIRHVQGGGHL